jgi:hypothetical protein
MKAAQFLGLFVAGAANAHPLMEALFRPGSVAGGAQAGVVELASSADLLVAGSGNDGSGSGSDGSGSGSLLECRTLATAGPRNWGHAIVYCPEGTTVTGGGMQSNFGAFERSHPWVTDIFTFTSVAHFFFFFFFVCVMCAGLRHLE